jgi:hypothetical protein
VINPKFPDINKDKIVDSLMRLPIMGQPFRPSKNMSCASCAKSTKPIGRILWTGLAVCTHRSCEFTALTNITALFKTPYGSAIDQHILRIMAKSLEEQRIAIQIEPVQEHAESLVDGYIDLVRWQNAIHHYARLTHPDSYNRGSVTVVPPRKINEVMVFRSSRPPMPIDPTENMRADIREAIRKIYEHGPDAIVTPF